MLHFELFNYAEMLALLTSIFCIRWIYKTFYIYFVPYMLMTVAAEICGRYLGRHHLITWNIQMFNVTTVVEFVFFFFLFYKSIRKKSFKRTILILIPVYVVAAILNQWLIQGFSHFHSYTMIFGTVICILFVFFYFYDAFENNEPINLLREPMFWISIGIFFFYLGDFTFNTVYPYLTQGNTRRVQRLFNLINHNLIIFEYVCFSIALIICSRNRSTLKQQS